MALWFDFIYIIKNKKKPYRLSPEEVECMKQIIDKKRQEDNQKKFDNLLKKIMEEVDEEEYCQPKDNN